MRKTIEEVYGVEAVRGFDPVRAAEARERVQPFDVSVWDLEHIHPYYVEKAETLRREKCFDADADMRALAAWAEQWETLPDDMSIVLADSSGTIWGFARPAHRSDDVETLSAETCKRLGLSSGRLVPELGMGMADVQRVICRPVVTVRIASFSGQSEFSRRREAECRG